MKTKLDKKTTDLYQAMLSLQNISECTAFLRDLLTEGEIKEFGERWYIVRSLAKGLTYREIQKLTGQSLTTITRVAKWYKSGAGGYRLVLARIAEKQEAEG